MKKNRLETPKVDLPKPGTSGPDTPKSGAAGPDTSTSHQSRAQRDANMSSPTAIRNTTAPRKIRNMPEDEGYKDRDPESDYDGEDGKDH